MLVIDLYSLLPAFTLASFLLVLLWPENITYQNRLRLILIVLFIWVLSSLFGMAGYGTISENRMAFLINVIVGCLGLIAVFTTLRLKPNRKEPPTR